MDGTIGFLWDTDDGYTFAILANTRPEDDGCAWDARGMIEDILYDVSQWPNYDLFTGSHKALDPIVTNPDLGQLPGDLVFQSPTQVGEFPTYRVPKLPSRKGEIGRSSMLDLELTVKQPETTPTPEPTVSTKQVRLRGTQGIALSFPTADGWDYHLQRSSDGQHWTTQATEPDRRGNAQVVLPTDQPIELFRVRVESTEGTKGDDPTKLEARFVAGETPFRR